MFGCKAICEERRRRDVASRKSRHVYSSSRPALSIWVLEMTLEGVHKDGGGSTEYVARTAMKRLDCMGDGNSRDNFVRYRTHCKWKDLCVFVSAIGSGRIHRFAISIAGYGTPWPAT